MSSPILYKDFGKSIKDFLSKKFKSDQNLKLKSSAGNLTVATTATYKKGAYGAEVTATLKQKDKEVVVKANTNNTYEVTGKATKLHPGLKVSVSGKNAAYGKDRAVKKHAVVDVAYKTSNFAGQAVATVVRDTFATDLVVSGSIGEDNISVGVSYPFKFGGAKKSPFFRFSQRSTAVQWTPKDLTATVLCKPKGVVELGYVHKTSAATTFGGKFTTGASPSFEVGSSHKLDGTTNLHGKFNTAGNFNAAVEKKFAEPKLSVALTYGFSLSGTSITQIGGTGVQFKVGDA
jgi:hypothetical protein